MRVNGGTNISYPGQHWVSKLVIYRFRTGCVGAHWRDLNLHHDTSFIPLPHTLLNKIFLDADQNYRSGRIFLNLSLDLFPDVKKEINLHLLV